MVTLPYDAALYLLVGADLAGWLIAYLTQPIPPRNRIRPWRAVLFILFNGALIAGVLFAIPDTRFPVFVAAVLVYLLTNPWFICRIPYDGCVSDTRLGRAYTVMCWALFTMASAGAVANMLTLGVMWPLVVIGLCTLASLLVTKPAGIIHQQQELLMGIQHAAKRHHKSAH